ncbi:MAG: TonB family protein [Cyclobacteriaceae bacterium]
MELKKNPKYDLEGKRPLFLSIGLVVALFCVTIAFNWRSEYDPVIIQPNEIYFDELPIIYNTKIEPPKPVVKPEKSKIIKPNTPTKIVAASEDETVELIKVVEASTDDEFDNLPIADAPIDVEPEVIHDFVESMPEFPGGMKAFYAFISKEINYPHAARKMNMSGRVYVQFVIDKDGSITDVKTVKGIGLGCDKEAERVIGLLPNFIPGKQRGRAVKVKMILPITFMLN